MTPNVPSICTVALLVGASVGLTAQVDSPRSGSWSGVIINSTCTADEAFAEAAKCAEPGPPGSMLSLYDETIRQVYLLQPQNDASGHLGDSVTVTGTLTGNAIHVTSLKMDTSIGVGVGEKAPAFSARDQLGRQQTLETLKGPKGTVLLFFRSADW
jgi:hypothetical protein